MANGIRTSDPRGFNKGRSSKLRVGSRVPQTPEEGRRTYRPKRCGDNNRDEDNSPKTLNDKNKVFQSNTGLPCSVVANELDCDMVVSEFDLQSRDYVQFWTNTIGKGINLLTPDSFSFIFTLWSAATGNPTRIQLLTITGIIILQIASF